MAVVTTLAVFFCLSLFKLTQSSAPIFIEEARLLLSNDTNIVDQNSSVDYESLYTQSVQDTVAVLLQYAYGAYASHECVREWQNCDSSECFTASNALESLTIKEVDYVQYFSGFDTSTSTTIISFRGTHNEDNECTDCQFTKIAYEPITGTCDECEIHSGFYGIWKALKQNVFNAMKSIESLQGAADCKVSITGHSLGAALSQIATMEIKATYPDCDVFNVNFGSPGFGNAALVDYFNDIVNDEDMDIINTWRIVNRHDLVPLAGYYGDYEHTDVFIHYTWADTEPYTLQYTVCETPYTGDCAYELKDYCQADHFYYLQLDKTCKSDPDYSRSAAECAFSASDILCEDCVDGNICSIMWPCDDADEGYTKLPLNMPIYLSLSILFSVQFF